MNDKILNVCVTGAAGQIAYSFLPQLLRGLAFPKFKINLRLLDIPSAQQAMKGIILQIYDCNYPLLVSVISGSNPNQMFKDADVIVFIGGFPRKKGMQRKDLLEMNKKIFIQQSKALSNANKNVKCVVVANPANTNAYILSHFNQQIPKKNITCLTRLDQNRAISQLVLKTKSRPQDIKGVMIFGNHSLTQYPGINNLKIKGKNAKDIIQKQWLEKSFIHNVQNRGGQILKVRGGSSVFSAASATIDHLRDWYYGTNGQIVSMGVVSDGSYGIPKGVFSSFPVRCKNFEWEIVKQFELTQFCKQKIKITSNQLIQEIELANVPKPKL